MTIYYLVIYRNDGTDTEKTTIFTNFEKMVNIIEKHCSEYSTTIDEIDWDKFKTNDEKEIAIHNGGYF